MSEHLPQVRDLFQSLLKVKPRSAQLAYLDEKCDGALELKHEVLQLLQADEQCAKAGFLVWSSNGSSQAEDANVGRRVDRYRLTERIGEGASGVVYRAIRADDIEQTVAIKLLRPWFQDTGGSNRFRAERQALADVSHPGIARLLDWGRTDEGSPYLVMEHIDGAPLDQVLRQNNVPLQTRVAWFLSVCEAVAAAHAQGILHRDLKPANIILTDDQQAVITDFGLAKFVGGKRPEFESFTATGSTLGTPGYMAPEQVNTKRGGIGFATDVYGLGSVLYFLLTGNPPFRDESIGETIVAVCERQVQPPTALDTSIDRDIQTICLKCLEKDPERRYPSVNALVEDVQRHLAGSPIEARPISASEQLIRWAKRNRALAIAIGGSVLLTIAAFITITSLWLVAERQRDELEVQRNQLFAQVDELLTDSSKQLQAHPAEDGVRRSLLDRAREHHAKMLAVFPDNKEGRVRHAEANYRLASLADQLLDRETAVAIGRESLSLFQRLEADYPQEHRFAFDVFHCYLLLRDYPEAHRQISELCQQHPLPDYQGAYGAAAVQFASQLETRGDREAASRCVADALDVIRDLTAAFPAEPRYLRRLHQLNMLLAEYSGDNEQAFQAAKTAFEALIELFNQQPRYKVDFLPDLCFAGRTAMYAAWTAGRHAEAVDVSRRLLEIFAQVMDADRRDVNHWHLLLQIREHVLLYELYDDVEGKKDAADSLGREAELAYWFWPDDPFFRDVLCGYLTELASPENRDLDRAANLLVGLNPSELTRTGVLHLRQGELEKAESCLSRRSKDRPWRLLLALVYAQRQQYERAAEVLQEMDKFARLSRYQLIADEVRRLQATSPAAAVVE